MKSAASFNKSSLALILFLSIFLSVSFYLREVRWTLWVVLPCVLWASFEDLKSYSIPIIMPLVMLVIALADLFLFNRIQEGAIAGGMTLLVFSFLAFYFKNKLGWGDVWFAAAAACFLVPENVPVFMLSSSLGGILWVLGMKFISRNRETSVMEMRLALVPFLGIGWGVGVFTRVN